MTPEERRKLKVKELTLAERSEKEQESIDVLLNMIQPINAFNQNGSSINNSLTEIQKKGWIIIRLVIC